MGKIENPIHSRRRGPSMALLVLAFSAVGREGLGQAPPPPPPLPVAPAAALPLEAPALPAPATVREALPGPSLIEGLSETNGVIEIKVGRGRFITLKEDLAVAGQPAPFIAVGDPGVADFFQVGPRQLRLIGKKIGRTDLSVTTGSGKSYDYELHVVADLDALRVQLRQSFPDASLKLTQFGPKVVVEGQARGVTQVSRIVAAIDSYMKEALAIQLSGQVGDVPLAAGPVGDPAAADPNRPVGARGSTRADGMIEQAPPLPGQGSLAGGSPFGGSGGGGGMASPGAIATNQIATGQSQVINLIRVPSSQQVLLKVRVAELNRTAFRQIGADFLAKIPQFGDLFGTQIGGATFLGSGTAAANSAAVGSLAVGNQSTVYGTFSKGQFSTVLSALRRNNVLKILAEPNLVTLNGFQANFLAGGEFPVPVLQGSGGAGGSNSISVQFKEFGVRLGFLPIIQDGDVIRLTVDPEVSTIDFSVGTTLIPGGSPVPGLNTRKSHATVELRPGDTLALAGLMQLSLGGSTQRIPGLGDLPYIGEFFSNTTSNRVEKELVVMITPYIVEPMAPEQVPAMPGDEVREPNDLEFFLLNRIEGRTGIDKRSTTSYDDPLHLIRHSIVEKKYLIGPSGYSK